MLLYMSHIVFEIGLAVILAISAGYASHASIDLTQNDSESRSAHKILVVCSIISWVTVIATVLAFVGQILFPEEIEASPILRKASRGLMYVILIILLVVGILMAIASAQIRGSPDYGSNKSEYKFASTGAIIALIVAGTVGVLYVCLHMYDRYKHGNFKRSGAKTRGLPLGGLGDLGDLNIGELEGLGELALL